MSNEPSQQPVWLLPTIIGIVIIAAGIGTAVITANAPQRAAPAPTAAPFPTALPTAIPQPTGVTADAALPETHGALDPNAAPVEELEPSAVQQYVASGTAIIIDVRGSGEYAAGRIPGALTITSPDLNTQLAAATPETIIIAYGSADRSESGQRGAQIFADLGFTNVAALRGGFEAWQAAGFAVER